MFRRFHGRLPEEIMQLIFRAYLELLTLMVIDRRYFRALAVGNELD